VAEARDAEEVERLEPGTKVEVRRRFDQHWSRGFEVAAVVDDGYTLRRVSDKSILPVTFSLDEVRAERKKQGLWWY
jgi:hypothetical protein